jgi:hypothetical protein
VALLGACTGQIGTTAPEQGARNQNGEPGTPGSPVSGSDPMTGASPAWATLSTNAPTSVVRLLSQRELGNAIETLVGFRPQSLSSLPADRHDLVYDRVVDAQTISSLHEDAYEAIADEIADKLIASDFASLVPSCKPAAALGTDGAALGTSRRPCIQAVIDGIAPRAFRRALDPDQRAALLDLYDQAMSYRDGARQVVHGIFRSPSFLYLVEYGQPIAGQADALALTDDEIAARLSFGLCETLPDDALRSAAAAGKLHDPDDIAREATRLLALPCAKATVQSFWTQWFRLSKLNGLTRDAMKYPEWTPTVATAVATESSQFFDYITWDRSGSLHDLFATKKSVIGSALAPLYGLSGLADTPAPVDLPAERRGILTQPSILAITSDPDASSPVKRGVYVLQSVLCQSLPQRPQNLVITTPAANDAKTTRERWAQHSSNPACSFCHQMLDPVGFSMEDFDAIGRHRTTENGLPIDASGGIPSLNIPDHSVTGAGELSDKVADLDAARTCFSRQWLRFALGRMEVSADVPDLDPIAAVARSNGSLQSAFLSLVRTPAFRQRPRVTTQ